MNWDSLFEVLLKFSTGFGSGLIVAAKTGISKIVEDVWTDHRDKNKQVRKRKAQLVSQLLIDIPKGRSVCFTTTAIKRSEGEQIIAQISSYDKKMAKKIRAYLELWRNFASANSEFDQTFQILVPDVNGDMEEKGLDYLNQLSSKLYDDYDEIIDLLNRWNK